VRGHDLRVLERAAGFEIGGDARGAESMAANPNSRAEIGGAALNHTPGVNAVHRLFRQRVCAANGGAEEGALAVVADAGDLDVSVKVSFEIVMRRHFVTFDAFLIQTDRPAFAFGIVVLDTHSDGCANSRKGERHHRNQRPIAEADHG
jgi:hypothetical protein